MITIYKLFNLLKPTEQKRAGVIIGMILVMALLDMVGVASILPFMAVLANPQLVEKNDLLLTAFQLSKTFGVQTTQQFLIVLGALVFILLITSLGFKAFTTYEQSRFVLMCEYTIGKRLVEGYLHQPYSWFLNRHSTDLAKNILSEVSAVIGSGMTPLMIFIAQSFVTVALMILLLIVDPLLALTVSLVLGIAYFTVFSMMGRWLKEMGQARIKANQERFTAVNEAFFAFKEVKVGGLEQAYIQRFSIPAKTYAKIQTAVNILGQLPRFLLEAIAFGGMLLITLYLLISHDGNFGAILPVIALYVFAGYKLMPALQQIYGALTQLRFAGATLNILYVDLQGLQTADDDKSNTIPMSLTREIRLHQIMYRYPNALQPSLKGINLSIAAFSKIAFVGTTGSGKTTMVDVILGLLDPQEGMLTIDGQRITSANRRQWQRAIGYVPQQIHLIDASLAANIAFGVYTKDIDQTAIEHAAKIANLHHFAINDLPQGYNTIIGERGIRLSGGQRQRIGIARALYHRPQVLILDESTSALDSLTEQDVMRAIHNIGYKITTITVTHRLSTVRECDQIYLLDGGRFLASGTFEELATYNKRFAAMLNDL